jgi:hypothetical protein
MLVVARVEVGMVRPNPSNFPLHHLSHHTTINDPPNQNYLARSLTT